MPCIYDWSSLIWLICRLSMESVESYRHMKCRLILKVFGWGRHRRHVAVYPVYMYVCIYVTLPCQLWLVGFRFPRYFVLCQEWPKMTSYLMMYMNCAKLSASMYWQFSVLKFVFSMLFTLIDCTFLFFISLHVFVRCSIWQGKVGELEVSPQYW